MARAIIVSIFFIGKNKQIANNFVTMNKILYVPNRTHVNNCQQHGTVASPLFNRWWATLFIWNSIIAGFHFDLLSQTHTHMHACEHTFNTLTRRKPIFPYIPVCKFACILPNQVQTVNCLLYISTNFVSYFTFYGF